MTINSARFANFLNSAVILETAEAGSVLIEIGSGRDFSGGWRGVWQSWDGETNAFEEPPGPSPMERAKVFVARYFDGLELWAMKDWKDSLPAAATPKLQAAYGWVQGVIASAGTGETSFAPPPCAFADVLAEISNLKTL